MLKVVLKVVNEIESMLGFKIRKVIAIIPSYFAEFNMIKGEISITNEDKIITSTDVINVFQVAMKNHIDYTKENGLQYFQSILL